MAAAKRSLRWWEKVHAELGLRGWSVAELARRMGMKASDEPQLRRWLKGTVEPRLGAALEIASALGWTLDRLSGQIYAPEEEWTEEQLARVMRSLTPDARKIVHLLGDPAATSFLAKCADAWTARRKEQGR